MKSAANLASTIAAGLLIAGCSASLPDASVPHLSLGAGAHYVAMGSSFAAGPGIGSIKPGTPQRCSRSTENYATLLANALDLVLDDQSCSGATTEHVLHGWDELPAQTAAVNPHTRLVTITVGGNDLDYMGLLFAASCDPARGMQFEGERVPCPPLSPPMPSQADYAQLETDLAAIANRVHQTAPAAKVVFVQYVSLVPETLCNATPLDAGDAAKARLLAARLAEVTASAARQSGAQVLAADQLSASHSICDAAPWSQGFPASEAHAGVPWHPTALGHAEIARELATMLEG